MDDLILFLLWCVAIGTVFTMVGLMEWFLDWLKDPAGAGQAIAEWKAYQWARDRVRWVKWFNWQ